MGNKTQGKAIKDPQTEIALEKTIRKASDEPNSSSVSDHGAKAEIALEKTIRKASDEPNSSSVSDHGAKAEIALEKTIRKASDQPNISSVSDHGAKAEIALEKTIRKASDQPNISSVSDHGAQAEPVFIMFMEIGFSQAEQMEKEARKALPDYQFEIKNDLAGLPRTAILIGANYQI